MLKKLFGGKKKEFYAQLDESKIAQAPAQEGTAPVVSEVVEAESETTAKTTTAEAPKPAAVSKSKKTSVKKAKTATTAKTETPVAPAPAPIVKVEPTQVEFATKYLITQTLSRRLPGPSLNKFKEMASQVKTR